MKLLMAAAALAMGAPAIAQTNMPINPDGIDMHGHNPDGQAFTPPGYNTGIGMAIYPPMALAPAGMIGGDYPRCTAENTDRCVQTYVRYNSRMRR